MPPEVSTFDVPNGWFDEDETVLIYLRANGIIPKTPRVRSSDWPLICRCPYLYYLKRRLGFTPGLFYSEALERGSWFHLWADLYHKGLTTTYEDRVGMRVAELQSYGRLHGVDIHHMVEKVDRDARCARAWFEAALPYPFKHGGSIWERVYSGKLEVLGTEIDARFKPVRSKVELGGRFDMLLFDKAKNKVWILDLKTTGVDVGVRLSTCPYEFQTQLYMHLLQLMLQSGLVRKEYPQVPADAGVGGMMHVGVRKPTINFGMKDRDCHEYEHELKGGPRKGQVEIRREYVGEPKLENYLRRCKDWYQGRGEYLSLRSRWDESPPVDISYTYGSCLEDELFDHMLKTRLAVVTDLATRVPTPRHYLGRMNTDVLATHGKPHAFTPFYTLPPSDWPEVCRSLGVMVDHRDKETDDGEEESDGI